MIIKVKKLKKVKEYLTYKIKAVKKKMYRLKTNS